jgi:hypothetical protein
MGPPPASGELPEDAVEQEAVGPGDGAGLTLEAGVVFGVHAFDEVLEAEPMAVFEEGCW